MVKKIYHNFFISIYLSYVMHYTYEITQKKPAQFCTGFYQYYKSFFKPNADQKQKPFLSQLFRQNAIDNH
ncbi:hypothetical protein J2783_002077 [Chryseobacterium sediminis]|nr:hypothetical protein [Chryseobacterium sediminis]